MENTCSQVPTGSPQAGHVDRTQHPVFAELRVVVIDRDPAWWPVLEAAAREAGLEALKRLEEPAAAVESARNLSTRCNGKGESFEIVLWNLESPEQFDTAVQKELVEILPGCDSVVAVAEASEAQVVSLLQAGVTYLWDKADGPEAVRQSFLHLVGLEREVRACRSSLEIEYPTRNWVEISAPSESKFVESLAAFVQLLTRTKLPERKRRSLAYALREIGQNAVEWGNANDPRKQIHMSFCILQDRVLVKLEDEGSGFDPAGIPDARTDPLKMLLKRREEGKRAGGYGLAIVRGLMDKVVFNERGNAVVLVVSYEENPAAEARRDCAAGPDGGILGARD